MIDTLLSFIAPHLCLGCGQTGLLMCQSCKENIVDEASERCIACERQTGRYLCNGHADVIEYAWYVARRADALEWLIDAYKFENARTAYRPLGDLLNARLPDLSPGVIVVPVPTIAAHIRQRGYDHVLLVARRVAALRGLRVAPLLTRRTNTKQRDASRAERERQAREAFNVRGVIDPHATYLVIDDVATTGATLRAAARELRQAGAQHVWVAAIARQPLD